MFAGNRRQFLHRAPGTGVDAAAERPAGCDSRGRFGTIEEDGHSHQRGGLRGV